MTGRQRTPASMRVRAAVKRALQSVIGSAAAAGEDPRPLVLAAVSGGADSLALAAALAAEARDLRVRAGAVIVDHGLQAGSAPVAERAAQQARGLGLDPVVVRRVTVESGGGATTGGIEAAARDARYAALGAVARELGASYVLTAHTRSDQAEQVLLALARGSGTRSLAGIPVARELVAGVALLRPLVAEGVGVTRADTAASCAELGLEPWHDPHNQDRAFSRVRVRADVLPFLEAQLGPGFGTALARSADLAREDADALDSMAEESLGRILAEAIAGASESPDPRGESTLVLPVRPLVRLPDALRHRVIRLVAQRYFDASLTRGQTLAIAALVARWRGQGPAFASGLRVERLGDTLHFSAQSGHPRGTAPTRADTVK